MLMFLLEEYNEVYYIVAACGSAHLVKADASRGPVLCGCKKPILIDKVKE
jgi:hypothetical protein